MRRLVFWLSILWVLGVAAFVGARVYGELAAQSQADDQTPAASKRSDIVAALKEALRTGDENTRVVVVTARKRDADQDTGAGTEGNIGEEQAPSEAPQAAPPPPSSEPCVDCGSPEPEGKAGESAPSDQMMRDLAQEKDSRALFDQGDQGRLGTSMDGSSGGGMTQTEEDKSAPSARRESPPKAAPPAAKPAPGNTALTIQRITVYYGTDRTLEQQGTRLVYGSVPSGKLDFGSVEVTLPPKHERGALERPQWWRFEFVPDPQKHVVFQSFSRLDQNKFITSLRALVKKSAKKQAFVFIHGFNTSFEDAAMRTAQLDHDLNFDGAPIFYSWSSRAELNPLAYAADGTAADQTVPQLAEFLSLVAEQTGAERIHVIAHSMGNRALVGALAELQAKSPAGANHRPFHQIVLAAPDIDRVVFRRLAVQIEKAADNVTLYASAHDAALKASLEFNGFPRAGDATGGVVIVPGITTIDASAVATELFSFGHSFFADSRSVLDDIRALFDTGDLPQARGLHAVKIGSQVYWRID